MYLSRGCQRVYDYLWFDCLGQGQAFENEVKKKTCFAILHMSRVSLRHCPAFHVWYSNTDIPIYLSLTPFLSIHILRYTYACLELPTI